MEQGERLLPKKLVAQRYNIVGRTVDRWRDAGILPAPVNVNGRDYYQLSELERHERQRIRERKDRGAS